jgi:superfamily II DNA or RNA helicase
MLQEPQSRLGQVVSVRHDHWRVLDITRHDGCESWQIEGVRPTNRGDRRTLLVPFDRPRALPPRRGRGRLVGRRRGFLALRALAAGTAAAGQLRGVAAAGIEILDYQLEPALACLRGAARILIADEVGLGKTIEAAVVLAELASRGEAERVLVLAPASLCEQWAGELSSRFHLNPVVVERAALARLAAWSSADEGPWARLPLAIASIDYVKQPEVLRGMGSVRWDLLVVDEAHACAVARHRGAALAWLSRRARRLLLLTATPHAGDRQAFRALCDVGRFPGEPPVTMFRRTRAGLGIPPTRRVRLARVAIGAVEARMHGALLAYAARVWRRNAGDPAVEPARLAMTVLCKRAASGPVALLVSLQRRLALLGRVIAADGIQLSLPLEEDPGHEDETPDGWLAAPGLGDEREERHVLERLIGLARDAAAGDAKTRVLRRLLARARQPVLVFTEYRDTLEWLAPRLAPPGEVATLHGRLDRDARRAAVDRFTSGRASVLLATDAASLGLNLHAACHLVVNHDLPWSPMRLEQRIGRLDRIGQRQTVHAVHLVARGTFEDQVLGRLALRVEAVRRSIGLDASPLGVMNDTDVAAVVIGGASNPAGPSPNAAEGPDDELFERIDLRSEARDEARRLLAVRALAGTHRAGRHPPDLGAVLAACERTAPWRFVVRAGRFGVAPGVYAFYRVRVVDGRGTLLHEEVVPLFLPAAAETASPSDRSLPSPPAWRRVAAAFDAVAAGVAGEMRSRVESLRKGPVDAWRQRESRMAEVDGCEPEPVQPGLFDHRALKVAGEVAGRRQAAVEEAAARVVALDAAARPQLDSPPECLLVFAAGRGRRPRWA